VKQERTPARIVEIVVRTRRGDGRVEYVLSCWERLTASTDIVIDIHEIELEALGETMGWIFGFMVMVILGQGMMILILWRLYTYFRLGVHP
jgi:hypothetical protein